MCCVDFYFFFNITTVQPAVCWLKFITSAHLCISILIASVNTGDTTLNQTVTKLQQQCSQGLLSLYSIPSLKVFFQFYFQIKLETKVNTLIWQQTGFVLKYNFLNKTFLQENKLKPLLNTNSNTYMVHKRLCRKFPCIILWRHINPLRWEQKRLT